MRRAFISSACAVSAIMISHQVASAGVVTFPDGFFNSEVTANWNLPGEIAFAPDGSIMFVAELRGVVRAFVNDSIQPNGSFLNLQDEVGFDHDHGMLGITVDPNYAVNKFVYVHYNVDPTFGEPNESADLPTFSRVTRYTATPSGGGVVGTNRLVLIGASAATGIPDCWNSHGPGALAFGPDGKLLIAHGDGARYEFADAGGNSPGCVSGGEDIGAFRSQDLDSLDGKILRVDPATGNGLRDNPYFTGNVTDKRSKVFISGLRNPFRFCVKPGSPGKGTLLIGDVGWDFREEISVAVSGDNCGWPCYEGNAAAPTYPTFNNAWSCATIGTVSNPGLLKAPVITVHHSNGALSVPSGVTGNTIVGGVFYTGTSFPLAYQNAYFYADYSQNWIRVAKFNASNQLINSWEFVNDANGPVSFAADPVSGDIYYSTLNDNTVFRVSYSGPGTGDVNGDFSVNISDLTEVILHWGACPGGPPVCPADIDGDGDVDIVDLTNVILHWS